MTNAASETSKSISPERLIYYRKKYGEPLCFFCGGRMKLMISRAGDLIKNERDGEGYQCPDCEAILWRGYPAEVVERNIDEELKGRERGMIKKKGGGRRAGRKRQEKKVFRGRYGDYEM